MNDVAKIYQDKEIRCMCGELFLFTAGEQEFYERKGLNDPKRCATCKAKKRAWFDKKDAEATHSAEGPDMGPIDDEEGGAM